MKQLNALYWFHSINGFAWSMIGIFIPIYFLRLGYAATEIFRYELIWGLATFLLCIAAAFLCIHLGMKRTLLMSLPFLFIFIWLLYNMGTVNIPLPALAVLFAFNNALYWIPLHFFFIKNFRAEKVGGDTGKFFAYFQGAGIIGPIIGGATAAAAGFPALFAGSAFINLAAVVFLAKMDDFRPRAHFKLSAILAFIKKYPRYFLAEMAHYFQYYLEQVIWPIFVFLLFGNIFSIGIVGALMVAGGTLFMLAVGHKSDKVGFKKFIIIGGMFSAMIWTVRFFVGQEILIYITTLAAGFLFSLIKIPLSALGYSIAKKENYAEFVIFREIAVFIGRILVFGLAILLLPGLNREFIIAAFSNLLFFLL